MSATPHALAHLPVRPLIAVQRPSTVPRMIAYRIERVASGRAIHYSAELYCEECAFRSGRVRFASTAALRRGCPCPRCADPRVHSTKPNWLVVFSGESKAGGSWNWSLRRDGIEIQRGSSPPAQPSYDAVLRMATDHLHRSGMLKPGDDIPSARFLVEPVGSLNLGGRRRRKRRTGTPLARLPS